MEKLKPANVRQFIVSQNGNVDVGKNVISVAFVVIDGNARFTDSGFFYPKGSFKVISMPVGYEDTTTYRITLSPATSIVEVTVITAV